jgi:ABC-2 type transport system permease protein
MFSLLWHELVSRRTAILGWSIGLIFFGFTYLGIYPSMADQMSAFDLSAIPMYEAMGVTDMASFEGYAAGTFINFLPIILAIYAIVTGTATLAGEEDDGTLELLVTLPLPRWQIVLVKALAIGLVLLVVLLITAVGLMGIFISIQNDITTTVQTADWLPLVLAAWPITMAFGMISLFFGAIAPNRRMAGVMGTVFFLANYFGHAVTGLATAYEGWRPFFLFHYYDNSRAVFSEGVSGADMALLVGVAAVGFALALLAFQRRNLMVGTWVWR